MESSSLSELRHRRTSSLKDWEFLKCMNELDETVASLDDTNSSLDLPQRRRGFTEDGSVGTSNTLTTDYGHLVMTRHRVQIRGMDRVKTSEESGGHRRSKSLASHRSRGSQRSKGSLSLEQLIHDTILNNAKQDLEFDDHSPTHMRRVSSTEDILKDLQQADTVLTNEFKSMLTGNLLPPRIDPEDEPDLLPPIVNSIDWTQHHGPNENWPDPTPWADWGDNCQLFDQTISKSRPAIEEDCPNVSAESGEKTWCTFDTETETSMFSDPFWTDFGEENPFNKGEQRLSIRST